MKCPKCDTQLAMVAKIPDEQLLSFAITYEGDWLSARTASGTMDSAEKLLKSLAKDTGQQVNVFLHSMKHELHRFEFTYLILLKGAKSTHVPSEPLDDSGTESPAEALQ